MSSEEYSVQITSLSPVATEKDVYEFFAFCGVIENVEIMRHGEYACTAYVTFRDAHALETAVLLSGATIVDQPVCITHWGHYEDQPNFWITPAWNDKDETNSKADYAQHIPSAGEAVTMAQDVVKTMLAKGFVLGKDALTKAKAFDESHKVSATAAAKVVEFSERIGLVDTLFVGVEAVRSVDQRYHVSETTRSAVSAAGRGAAAAANTVANSSYFSRGALWMSDALSRAAKVAADLGNGGKHD